MADPSEVMVGNLALSYVGVGETISSLTEESESARAINEFFDHVRDLVLEDFPWPFATQIVTLGLIREDPNSLYGFEYTRPPTAVWVRRLLSGARVDSRESEVHYRLAKGTAGLVIWTDLAEAECEFTVKEEDPIQWTAGFRNAVAWRLAHVIAPRLTSGDPFKIMARAFEQYQRELAKAAANAFMEEGADKEIDPPSIAARNDGITLGNQRTR